VEDFLDYSSEKHVGKLLEKAGLYMVTAESCTGGLLSHLITNVPGSSAYFIGGVSTYAYEAKKKLLNVKSETLQNFGAVSRQTVIEMADGVRELFSGEIPREKIIGISITGIAGPGGGMPEKPVGLVWFGLSTPSGAWAWNRIWKGDREENKLESAKFALELISFYLNYELPPESF
jgi:nicotinamide-nucleotide amidase